VWALACPVPLALRLLLPTLVACRSGPPARMEDCADLACRKAWAVQRWPSDPQAVTAAVLALQDPLEQLAVSSEVAETWPGGSQALCAALPRGAARERCNQLNTRLHLGQDLARLTAASPRTAPGPASWRIDTTALPPSPLRDASTTDDPCPAAQADDAGGCREHAAVRAASQGDATRAAALCLAVGSDKWRAECAFQAAEARLEAGRSPADLAGAVDLCLLADRYADNCFGHLALRLGETVPPLDSATAQDWDRLRVQAQALASVLHERGADTIVPTELGLFWAETMAQAMLRSRTLSGDALDFLPPEAVPHVHAALAAALVQATPRQGRPHLEALRDQLAQVLATRRDGPVPPGPPVRTWRPHQDLWPEDRPGDGAIPAVIYMGVSRRAVAVHDVDADLQICLLEAWARLRPEEPGLLEEGARSDQPLVRWTAERLQRARIDPVGPGGPPPEGPPGGGGPGGRAPPRKRGG